jgi:signal transduction histidine kinase
VERLDQAADWPVPVAPDAAIVVPLVTTEALHGLLVVAGAGARHVDAEEELAMLTAFAGQAALALERIQAQEYRDTYMILEDRERIARDLHDVVIQRLFATGLQLQTAARLARVPQVTDRVNAAVDELDATIREIRSAIFELRTPASAELRGDVRDLVAEAAKALGFRPGLDIAGPVDSAVPDNLRPDVLAVLREALSNVTRHAAATAVTISLSVTTGRFTLTVVDNGVGIDDARPHSGLSNLRERAAQHDGSFTIEANSPTGTRLEWSAPI